MSELRPPEPGERCELCHRRVNKPRQTSSPSTSEARIRGPEERVTALRNGLDNLQEYAYADSHSYPLLTLLEGLLALGAQHREELREHFWNPTPHLSESPDTPLVVP